MADGDSMCWSNHDLLCFSPSLQVCLLQLPFTLSLYSSTGPSNFPSPAMVFVLG